MAKRKPMGKANGLIPLRKLRKLREEMIRGQIETFRAEISALKEKLACTSPDVMYHLERDIMGLCDLFAKEEED